MEEKLEMLHRLCKRITEKLEECERNLSTSKDMSVADIEIVDKLTHTLKSIKTTMAMMEAEGGTGSSSRGGSYRQGERSMEGGNSGRWYPGYAYADDMSRGSGSYADGGYSEQRGRSPSTGRYVSRDGGYSGHDGIEDIMMDVREMPEAERRKLKKMLE